MGSLKIGLHAPSNTEHPPQYGYQRLVLGFFYLSLCVDACLCYLFIVVCRCM